MTRTFAILMLIATRCVVAQDADGPTADEMAFFEKKIRPVLVQHCYKCHAADAKTIRGGLLLDTRRASRKGGDSGPAVVPHKPDESLLLESLRYDSYEMPPSGKLSDNIIADFEKWIAMGAPDPREGKAHAASTGIDIEAGRQFWSFQLPKVHPVPEVKNATWPRSDIDKFVLAQIERASLEPAVEADKRTLLRRVYFDVIGLPPTPQQIRSFLDDESPGAFERVVDQLLASPRFGERWGRHWLDIARYSDSTGGGRSLLFKVSWRYRNYVIDAFNRDTPFDEFIIEQIAGDLMPSKDNAEKARHLTGTGFLALGPTNYENQDKRQLRMDVIDEQIDTIGRAFLGMTIGCARCHDHKFDPIPTADYYALAGIFRSTRSLVDGNVSNWITRALPSDNLVPEGSGAVAGLTKQLKAKKRELAKLMRLSPAETVDDIKARLIGSWTDSTVVKSFYGPRYVHTTDPDARAVFEFNVRKEGSHELLVSYTPQSNRDAETPHTISCNGQAIKTVRIDQRQRPKRFVSLGHYDFSKGDTVAVTVHTSGTENVVIADAVTMTFVGTAEALAARKQATAVAREIGSLQTHLTSMKKAVAATTKVMSVEEESNPADFHVCIRGNVRNLGERVPRGFLSVASASVPAIPDGTSGRLELARWIASPDNPLTARVAVNRIWHHLFGSGLVRTVDNFGAPGERPSHPRLLDYLAQRFVENGWSVKQVVRDIVLSQTYQQSSTARPAAGRQDPENRLFARQNLRRLQAEALRDALFAISGELQLSPPGDTVREGTKSEYGYQFTSKYRSVYLPVFRNRLHPMFAVFDFPDPNLSNGRRNTSTLSTQALYLMNSPLINEHTAKTAAILLADDRITDAERLKVLYEKAIGRPPTANETRLTLSFLSDATGEERDESWVAICQALIGSVDFRYVR